MRTDHADFPVTELDNREVLLARIYSQGKPLTVTSIASSHWTLRADAVLRLASTVCIHSERRESFDCESGLTKFCTEPASKHNQRKMALSRVQ